MRYLFYILTFSTFFLTQHTSSARANEVEESLQDTLAIEIDTTTIQYKLWEQIRLDTFPYHLTHHSTRTLGISSLLKTIQQANEAESQELKYIKHQFIRTYLDNLLADSDTVLTFLEEVINNQFPELLDDLNGHLGLRRYLSCYNNPSDSCGPIRTWGHNLIKQAAETYEIMPKEQWQWLAQSISRELPYDTFTHRIRIQDTQGLDELLPEKDWEGAVLSFSRALDKKNLVYSRGSRFPLKILEWNTETSQWDDSTQATGLENYPGGYRLYTADINADGHQDLIVLRSASTRSGFAKLFPSIFINQGDGTFEDHALELGLDTLYKPQCFCIGDYNQDGLLDIYIGGLRDESKLLMQNADGTFSDKRYVYGMHELGEDVQDCLFKDLNLDGKLDLLLSQGVEDNKTYIQGLTNDGKHIYFGDQVDEYDLWAPTYGGSILTGTAGDAGETTLFLSDISERYDIFPFILSQSDSIVDDSSFILTTHPDQIEKTLLPSEVSLYRSGIWVATLDGMKLIYGGGKTTESILPLFEFDFQTHEIRVAYDSDLPIYIHSATVLEMDDQPYLLFKGGADYPIMQSSTRLLDYRPDSTGSYHKIFNYTEEALGSQISYQLIDPDGQVTQRLVEVRAVDSRGNNAMQEWIWLPEGYTLARDEDKLPDNLSEKQLKKLLKKLKKKKKK